MLVGALAQMLAATVRLLCLDCSCSKRSPVAATNPQADEDEARSMAGWAKEKVGDVVHAVQDKIGSGEVPAGLADMSADRGVCTVSVDNNANACRPPIDACVLLPAPSSQSGEAPRWRRPRR